MRSRLWLSAATALAATACATPAQPTGAPAPPSELSWDVPDDLAADSRVPPTVLWDRSQHRPRMIAGGFAVSGPPEAAARAFLVRHADRLVLSSDPADLVLRAVRTGRAGTYLRFQQLVDGLPVFDREVVVGLSSAGDQVRTVNLAHAPDLVGPAVADDVGGAAALERARLHLGWPTETSAPTVVRGVLVEPGPRLAYRVTLPATAPPATWEVTVDGATGMVLAARDRNLRADGSGLVFDMNPIASTGNTSLTDNNDQTYAALDAARLSVTLPRLDGSGFLRGTWVDSQPPQIGQRAQSGALTFDYDRADNRFEEVMAYYHIDRAQNRIQALGFTDVNARVQVAVVDDGNQDNSFYNPANKEVSFGQGGVDDAEDADILLHEYGHSIQDNQVPGWGNSSDASAMGEGFGDYLAASFGNELPTVAQPADQACVGDWDAISYDTGNPKCLRRVDGTKHYPERRVGQSHSDGEMWSAALWRARSAVGGDVMDALIFEGHFMMATNESFNGAATAVLMADQQLFGGSHVAAVRRALYYQGVLRTPLTGAAYTTGTTEQVNVTNPVVGNNVYANLLDDTQTLTRTGALAMRVHFATIETQAAGSCVGGLCDAIYLYDGNGDLYQILGGSQSNVLSVQVPGETIQIRLVTNSSIQRRGYVIDRLDVMGSGSPFESAPIDVPPPPDGITPDVPVPPDGTPPPDGSTTTDGGPPPDGSIDGGFTDAGEDPDDPGGCGCRTGGRPSGAALALLALAVVLRRRRRA